MHTIAPQTTLIDLEYLGHREAIASCLIEDGTHAALVDPGPSTSLPTLKAKLGQRGLGVGDLTAILLTHIHLDHAGATGTLVRENPRLRVYVHERGAPHLVDPSKLLASATKLYGDAMERLWGEVLPVPEANVQALAGGEQIALGTRQLDVAYTPGHAVHHVSYFDRATGIAFVGDTGGLRYPRNSLVLPLTPPPDIDLEAWSDSLTRIRAWQPQRLLATHFGPAEGVAEHVAGLRDALHRWAEKVRATLLDGGGDAQRAAAFARDIQQELAACLPERVARRYAVGSAPEQCWFGLARYWRKRTA